MPKFQDLTGMKFNRLTVIEKDYKNKSGRSCWKCICDCGNETIVRSDILKDGRVKSCGCLHDSNAKTMSKNNVTHGLSYKGHHHRIYNIWATMKQRCYNPNATKYENYGGRGITICDEWKIDVINFYNWAIANDYSENLSIDRINSNGNYEPSNCRWVTMKVQQNNRRNSHQIKALPLNRQMVENVGAA